MDSETVKELPKQRSWDSGATGGFLSSHSMLTDNLQSWYLQNTSTWHFHCTDYFLTTEKSSKRVRSKKYYLGIILRSFQLLGWSIQTSAHSGSVCWCSYNLENYRLNTAVLTPSTCKNTDSDEGTAAPKGTTAVCCFYPTSAIKSIILEILTYFLNTKNKKTNKNPPKLTLPIPTGPVCVLLYDVCAGQTKVSYFHLLIRAMKKNISRL